MDAIYIGKLASDNLQFDRVGDCQYFVYKRQYSDNGYGYQIGLKLGSYAIPIGLPYRNLQTAIDYATDKNNKE